jgi:uncharacterized protein YbjQ (UPF0145 family)
MRFFARHAYQVGATMRAYEEELRDARFEALQESRSGV